MRSNRFRNVLVHFYGGVDDKRGHDMIENEPDYFRMFLMDMDAIVESQIKKQKPMQAKKKR
jgi:uncharacterized protein YutE (UPF0331/DUF86 family)